METLKKRFWRVHPHKDVAKVLHHDNAMPHTSLHIREAITKPPASSTLQIGSGSFRLSSFQFFERCNPRKEVGDDEEVISEVKKWL
jgi:hypothetical protein